MDEVIQVRDSLMEMIALQRRLEKIEGDTRDLLESKEKIEKAIRWNEQIAKNITEKVRGLLSALDETPLKTFQDQINAMLTIRDWTDKELEYEI